jgi:hypothetical protein
MGALPNCIAPDIHCHSYAGFKYTSIHLIRPIVSSNLVLIQMFKYSALYFKIKFKISTSENVSAFINIASLY